MRKRSVLNGILRPSLRDVRTGMAVFACMVAVTVGGTLLGVRGAGAAAGQILKIVTSDGGSTFYVGRCFRTNFEIQTDTLDANSVDLIVPYNPSYLQPYSNSGCTSAATQINTHSLFPSYPSNTIENNEVVVTGYDPTGSSPVDTGVNPNDRIIGYLFWKVIAASGSYRLAYDYTAGLTTDTNMAENNGDGTDVLDAVENLTLNLSADGTAPTFTSLSPASGASNVSVTSNVTFLFADAGAGVNSGSLVARINGTPYSVTKSGCTTTNSNRKPQCNASIAPGTLSYATTYTVTATGSDLATPSNTGSTTWSFTTEDDDDAPYVENLSPAANATGVATSSNIQFNIKDYKNNAGVTPGLGVDTSSIEVTVTVGANAPVTYQNGDPEFSISGIAANRTVVINPSTNFPENTLVQVSVEASDLHSPANAMSTYSYSFRTVDSAGPSLSGYSPAQSAANVAADTNISFTVSDDGAGVSIGNTSVTVEGVTYTSASPQFSYTGNTGSYVITINPSSNFSGGQVVDVSISTRDLASPTPNTTTASYSFTIASSCTTCSVDGEDPARFATSATLDDDIVFHVKDTGAGINEDSIRITLIGTGAAVPSSPMVLTGSSPLVSITGTAADYTVTIDLPADIEENTAYSILIEAEDSNGLEMAAVGYTFMNLDVNAGGGGSSSSSSAASSVSSSSSSEAVSCPACNCPDSTADDTQSNGGRRRSTQTIIDSLDSDELPTVVRRRRLPDGTVVEEVIPADQIGGVRCYIDEFGRPAARQPLTHYEDIVPGAWYESAVKSLLDRGVLDAGQPLFRPDDSAVRAEFAKVLTMIEGIDAPATPAVPSFDDTERSAWYFPFTEEAGRQGWMKGYGDCYGTHPCMLKPGSATTRAEAVAMIVRYYGILAQDLAPRFRDVSQDAWYATVVQAAADRCIVQGDDLTGLLAPERVVNRAEMVALFARAEQNLRYGRDCGRNPAPASGVSGSLLGAHGGAAGTAAVALMALMSVAAVNIVRKRDKVR